MEDTQHDRTPQRSREDTAWTVVVLLMYLLAAGLLVAVLAMTCS